MISEDELKRVVRASGLNLYQQEKDYLLKIFLYLYYKRFDHAVFKGGTCIKYLYGTDRFSEDLDFNLKVAPKKFRNEVVETLKNIGLLGIVTDFKKEEMFQNAYTCEISFHGPLSLRKTRIVNKFRIDAGKRAGIVNRPSWELISSEYPEMPPNFLVLVMKENELLAEKIISLVERNKGRDLYDVWFLLKKGIGIDQKLIEKKSGDKRILARIKKTNFSSKREYERDMRRLASKVIPYEQIIEDIICAVS